ncbi:MAG: hypothetical protein HY704_14020 [Gemmatimonadetes bacterium]|nr:hypothetical protein [Gemmatimonadota bacterium]
MTAHVDPAGRRRSRQDAERPAPRPTGPTPVSSGQAGAAAGSVPGEPGDVGPGVRGPVCERCGWAMYERHCKIVCPNCGYERDCTDP